MKTVKSMSELHAAGAKVEGLRFIELKPKGSSPAELATILAAIDRNSTTLETALYASVKAIVESLGGQEITVNAPEQKATARWTFDIERDREGYLKRIVAKAEA